jgi:hypothetical protein
MRAIDRFVAGARSETLFLIHPDPLAVGARALETFVVRLGQRLRQTLSFADLSACSRPIRAASSQSAAFSHGVPSFQLLSHTQLKRRRTRCCNLDITIASRPKCCARWACHARRTQAPLRVPSGWPRGSRPSSIRTGAGVRGKQYVGRAHARRVLAQLDLRVAASRDHRRILSAGPSESPGKHRRPLSERGELAPVRTTDQRVSRS